MASRSKATRRPSGAVRRPSGVARRPSGAARRLSGAIQRPPLPTTPTLAPKPIGPIAPGAKVDSWTTVRSYLQRTCGVALSDDQRYLLDARLGGPARDHGFASVDAYVVSACGAAAPPAQTQSLIDALTTHETFFFRDPGFWKSFETLVLPKLADPSRGTRPIRIWSAACSSGQEPYTIAMLFAELRPDLAPRLEIVATDIAEPTLEKARKGVFSTLEVNRGLGAPRLVRHFEACPGGFRVKESLRRSIIWTQHNLLGAKPDPRDCDVVLCRNVLIYFNDLDRSSVVQRLARAATTGGLVAVGCTETLQGTALAPGWYPAQTLRAPSPTRPT